MCDFSWCTIYQQKIWMQVNISLHLIN
jgi:hypothetical protein